MNPKIWLGVKWLATYIAMKPGDLVRIREKDFDLESGVIILENPTKQDDHKIIPLVREDIELIQSFPRALPHLFFFRHTGGISGVKEGAPFGEKYFYKWWKKSCDNLGIEDVDLYGGTRHGSARALRSTRTPEEIKRATMHKTNKAFERYFTLESEDIREIYQETLVPATGKTGTRLVPQKSIIKIPTD